jgi:hypothetical protein
VRDAYRGGVVVSGRFLGDFGVTHVCLAIFLDERVPHAKLDAVHEELLDFLDHLHEELPAVLDVVPQEGGELGEEFVIDVDVARIAVAVGVDGVGEEVETEQAVDLLALASLDEVVV